LALGHLCPFQPENLRLVLVGICEINVFTDFSTGAVDAVRKALTTDNIRQIPALLEVIKVLVLECVLEKMKTFSSEGKV
jgi:fructose/tagatose bisphosphate aldolase